MTARLDDVVATQLGVSRAQARGLILAGRVRVKGERRTKPGTSVRAGDVIVERPPAYVSRGGDKLAHALDLFGVDPQGLDALDVGASTGGFTDVLLTRGAQAVTALDVGYGQLAWRVRSDPRVTVLERTNFRLLADGAFPGGFDLIVIDTSFISLRTIVARALAYLRANGTIVALVKPQFEAGREHVGKGGIVRDPEAHELAVDRVAACVRALGWQVAGTMPSPITGAEGNREFLLYAKRS